MMPRKRTCRPSWLHQASSGRSRPVAGRSARNAAFTFEPLEERLLLANGDAFPDVISVGRSLSAWSAADVQNGQLAITYSVYNQGAAAVSGVLLTTSLEPGITFVSATVPPDRNGQDLAWSLGVIEAYGRASVEVTVALASPLPLQIDGGACAFGTAAARAENDCAHPARIRAEPMDPDLLRSTPDANTTDPFVRAKAAELNQDAAEIFAFVRDEVSYESYVGSLRGARGTLWSNAGNSLDESSLMIALLRSSGIPARYVAGTLNDSQAQQLILSMFPAHFRAVGLIPAGTELADPANDPDLLAETRQHYWVQFDNGTGFQDADPSFRNAQLGQSFAAAEAVFPEVADALRAKTRITVMAEMFLPAAAAFGLSGLSESVVLDRSFNDVELVGVPLSIAHLVSAQRLGVVISAATITYSPYVRTLDSNAPNADGLIRGTDFQEVYTNFPLGSQVLTGLFLNVSLIPPSVNGPAQATALTKTLFDRIGFAARQSSQAVSVDTGAPQAAVSVLDVTTLQVTAWAQNPAALFAITRAVEESSNAQQQIVADLIQTDAAERQAFVNRLNTVSAEIVTQTASLLGTSLLVDSDLANGGLASPLLTRAYFDSPRVVAVSSRFTFDAARQSGALSYTTDILRDAPRVVVAPGQAAAMAETFRFLHGFADSVLEGRNLNRDGSNPGIQSTSAMDTLLTALRQGAVTTVISSANLASLEQLSLSAEAKARIVAAVVAGRVVFVPTAPVVMNASPTIAWLELEQTGDVLAVAEDGTHGHSFVQYAAAEEIAATELVAAETAGTEAAAITAANVAADQGGLLVIQSVEQLAIQRFGANLAREALKHFVLNALFDYSASVTKALISGSTGLSHLVVSAFKPAFQQRINFLAKLVRQDPPISDVLVAPSPAAALDDTSFANIAAPAALQPGVVAASLNTPSVHLRGALNVVWSSQTRSGFQIQTLQSNAATVRDGNGQIVGVGEVTLQAEQAANVETSGTARYALAGLGSLSFYAEAGMALGVSGDWQSYSAAITGDVVLQVSTNRLVLNGQELPTGTYMIATSAATMTGSGVASSPNFSGSAAVTASDVTAHFAPSNGTFTLAGSPRAIDHGLTLAQFTGSIFITSDGAGDDVTVTGDATHALSLVVTPNERSTDHITATSFRIAIDTTFSDTFRVTAQAPDRWKVFVDNTGTATVTPAPGTQGGSFPIRITATSMLDPQLVASADVTVTVHATQPGLVLAVEHDPELFVPFANTQAPTAFQVTIQNAGPSSDHFAITFPTVPAGFEVRSSLNMVMIPAGETAIVGAYLVPSGTLPGPGASATLEVVATSTTDPAITASEREDFIVPEIHGVVLTATPNELGTTPGLAAETTLRMEAVGNVRESITFHTQLAARLTLDGLTPVTLDPGQSSEQVVTITPDAGTTLGSTHTAAITASFGAPLPVTALVTVTVAVPGADAVIRAAAAVRDLGNDDLANRLTDLSIALNLIVEKQCDIISRSQAASSLGAIIELLRVDSALSFYAGLLTTSRDGLATAANDSRCLNHVNSLGTTLDNLAFEAQALAARKFEAVLLPSSQVVQPLVPANFELLIHNVGTARSTFDLRLFGLTGQYTGSLSQTQVTLDRDESASVMVTITQNVTDALMPLNFVVDVTVANSPGVFIFKEVSGALTVRQEFVSVVSVSPTPAFTDTGGLINVSARVLNTVNLERPARASFVVRDPNGVPLGGPSTPVDFTLGVLTSLVTLELGTIDTAGFARGSYTIDVSISDRAGRAIPGATGTGNFLIGSPVTGSITVAPDSVPPGANIFTNTLTFDSQVPLGAPFRVAGQAFVPGVANMPVRSGDLAYVAGSSGISVLNVADPTSPQLIRTVGQAEDVIRVQGDRLIAIRGGNTTRVSVYSMTDPSNPQLLGSTPENPIHFANDLVVHGNTAFVSTIAFRFNIFSNEIFEQFGEVLAVDISNPAAPQFVGQLFNTNPNGGDFNIFQEVLVDPQTLWIATTTATGTTVTGMGTIRVVDIADPTQMSVVREVAIPGAAMVTGIALDGNRAFVTTSTDGFHPIQGLMGNVVLATLDATDVRDPTVIDTQLLGRASRGLGDAVSIGNQMYAFSSLGAVSDDPQLILSDANDPMAVAASGIDVPSEIRAVTAANGLVYTASADGLIIYQIGGVESIPATASVQVPKNSGVSIVAGSFNVTPTEIISGVDFDTLRWVTDLTNSDPSRTFTWQSLIFDLAAGESRELTLDTTIDFTSQGAPGQVKLPTQQVLAEHLIAIDPASRTVRPGAAAVFHVTLRSPSNASTRYFIDVPGVPPEWVSSPDPGLMLPNESVMIPLTIQTDPFTNPGDFDFVVIAESPNGISDSVNARLTVAGDPVLSDPDSHGVVIRVSPAQADAGQGTAAAFVARITNTGSVTETFDLASMPPAGFAVQFGETSVVVPPGAGNFRDVAFTVTPPRGTAPGAYSFPVLATSAMNPVTIGEGSAIVNVLAAGADISITPSVFSPSMNFQLLVVNTGQFSDTFDLALGGPAAPTASLAANSITLAPGAFQFVDGTMGAITFAVPGDLLLTATATSRTSPTVSDSASAHMTIDPTVGLGAAFHPNMVELPQPGAATFVLMVDNTGNTEGVYMAEIATTSGPVVAALLGLDGRPAQSIPVFRLPGLAKGAVLVNANLTAFGRGEVTVRVTSLANPGVVASSNATVMSEPEIDPCTAAPAARGTTAAANVTARVELGRLTVLGDVRDNDIRITAGPDPHSFCITGNGGTTVNGLGGSQRFTGVTGRVSIIMRGGGDTVYFDGSARPISLPGDLRIRMNSIADTVRLEGVTVAGRTRIGTGRGQDLVELVDTVLAGRAVIGTGRGNDHIIVRDSQFLADTVLNGVSAQDSLDAGLRRRPNSNGNVFFRTPDVRSIDRLLS